MNAVNHLVKYFAEHKLTIAIAESVTCGLASSMIASYKGASEVLKGSVIAFTPEVKQGTLKVSESLIDQYTCESAQVTEAMCKGLRSLIEADVHVAITGLASAGGSETKDKPVGSVFYHFMYNNKNIKHKVLFNGTPLEIRKKASLKLFELAFEIAGK